MDASCMQLSIEGERMLKAGDYQGAIDFFEAALRVGTDDFEVLSAIYNQLGNACFYTNQFHKALEYHKKDLEIAEKLGDRQGQAKAFGNLGNTFKSLKNYANAIRCCESHLEITRELQDRLGEGRACYNLGNVHHALGKAKLPSKDPREQADGRKSIMAAIDYYKATLAITTDLKDSAGEGRAVGNLGNAYTAIGEYNEAITYHLRRLQIAKDANDMAAKARACGNLGNAYSALNNFSEATKYYMQSLVVAKESNNLAGQGQAYYCLGSTYVMMKNYVKAIEYHEQHLAVAEQLGDKQGQMRAWYSLRNAYHKCNDTAKTVHYHQLIREAQQASGSAVPAAVATPAPQAAAAPAPAQGAAGGSGGDQMAGASPKEIRKNKGAKGGGGTFKKLFKPKKTGEVEAFVVDDSDDDDDDIVHVRTTGKAPPKSKKPNSAMEWVNEAIRKQPAPASGPPATPGGAAAAGLAAPSTPAQGGSLEDSSTLPGNDFFDMLLAMQSTRIDDQRSPAPKGMGKMIADGTAVPAGEDGPQDESFFDMLLMAQGSRMTDQRSPAPKPVGAARPNSKPQAEDSPATQRKDLADKLDAENMSFFEMLAAAKN